jgi:hypothetical protein
MSRYQIHAATLHTTDLNGGSAVNIGGHTSMELSTGTETMSDESGSIYNEVRSLVSQLPEATLTTKSLATWLTYIGLAGYCISSDGSHPGLRLFAQVLNDCKSPPAANTNLRYTIGRGLVILGQLQASKGQDATLSLKVHAISDGTNAPFSVTYTSVTLPTSLLSQQFTLGVCRVGNILLTDLQSLTLDFGVECSKKEPECGTIWPESIAVRKIEPVATFTGFNPTILDAASIPLGGKQATHAQTIIQLKKRQNYASFVPDGTSEHIRLTMNGLATITQAFSGSGNGELTNVCRVEGVHDGTNVPILATIGSTYSNTPS